MSANAEPWEKAPGEELDYLFDFAPLTNGRAGAESDCLAAGETITSAEVSGTNGVTVDRTVVGNGGNTVEFWLTGGTLGMDAVVECVTHTSAGRTIVRQKIVQIQPR